MTTTSRPGRSGANVGLVTRDLAHATRTYPVRQLVAYRRLIVNGERVDPERVVAEYARANPGVDLEARSTVSDWQAGSLPGRGTRVSDARVNDTAERLQGLPIR